MKEKRQFERFEIQVPARIEISEHNGQCASFDLETQNLSAGGALITFVDPLPAGNVVKIDIVLSFEELKSAADPSGSLILSTTGHVVRSEQEGIAIRFDENYEFKARLDSVHQKIPANVR